MPDRKRPENCEGTFVKEKVIINVDQLLDGDKRVCVEIAPDPEYPVAGNVSLDVILSRSGENILVKGTVGFTLKLPCSRCSKEILTRKTEKIEVRYVPDTLFETEFELTETDVNTVFYQGNIVDLEQPVRDAIVLSIPMKFVCKADCKGLCPRCGKDLNEGKCSCTERGVDPRWQALGKLLH